MTQEFNPQTPASPSNSPALEDYYGKRLAAAKKVLPHMRACLRAANVHRVNVYYDGVGDSGGIERISFLDAQDKEMDPGTVAENTSALEELFYDLLESRFGGWENNDGAFGDFYWDLKTDQLKHEHHARFTDVFSTEVEGL